MSPPTPPDPMDTAQAQAQMNKETAISQAYLNNTNQITPYGTLTYEQTGTGPEGTPTFTATSALAPDQQALLDQMVSSQSLAGQTAQGVLANSAGMLMTPPDLSASGITANLMDLGEQYYQPTFDDQTASMDAKLRNQGIAPGSEAYTKAMNDLSQSQNQTMTGLLLQGQDEAMAALNQQYALPLTTYSTLMTGAQPANLGGSFVQTPQTSIQPPNYEGDVASANAAAAQQNSAMMSGLFGIPSSIFGGMMALSDVRVKDDIKQVGELNDGTPVYSYRYKGRPETQLGVIAQEVAQTHPDAVGDVGGGLLAVDYAALASEI